MRIHEKPFEFSGKTVKIKEGVTHPQVPNFGGQEFVIEDWWDRLQDKSWKDCDGNPAALLYAFRIADNNLPIDDEVVYGKVGSFGHLVHVEELEI